MNSPRLGPLGTYSQGRLNKNDRGDLRMAVIPDKAKKLVALRFGTEVTWLAMDPAGARGLAEALNKAADAVDE